MTSAFTMPTAAGKPSCEPMGIHQQDSVDTPAGRANSAANSATTCSVDELARMLGELQLDPPTSRAHACALFVRKVAVIDYVYIITLNLMVMIFARVLFRPNFSKETLQTLGQRKRNKAIELMQKGLEGRKVVREFCKETGAYVSALIPSKVAVKMQGFLSASENLSHFYLRTLPPMGTGYIADHALSQLNMRTGYRAALVHSSFGKWVDRGFQAASTIFAYGILDRSVIDLWVNFEHTFLSICFKPERDGQIGHAQTQKRIEAAFHSLATTLSKEPQIEKYLKDNGITREEHVIIARIEWARSRGMLPPGLPDPTSVRLDERNLYEELDRALYQHLSKLIHQLLTSKAPDNLRSWFVGSIWWLWGKDLVKEILTFLTAEYGIKTLVDPYLLTIALLTAFGEETVEYETDKFGRNTRDKVFTTGVKMIREALRPNWHASAIRDEFAKSGLRKAPGNTEGILQRKKAKDLLKALISKMIHDLKDNQGPKEEAWLKSFREKASRIPIVGIFALSLHGLINGSIVSWEYYFRNTDKEKSFTEFLGKHFLGIELCDFLADRIVALIYHPCWRITLLHLIDTLVTCITTPEQNLAIPAEDKVQEHFKTVASFLFDQFTVNFKEYFSLPVLNRLEEWAKKLTGDGAFEKVQQYLKPTNSSILEKALTPLLPSIKELALFTLVTDSFRREGVIFLEGTEVQFWECYIREYLNRYVSAQDKDGKLSLNDRSSLREKEVDHLLSLDIGPLRSRLASPPTPPPVVNPSPAKPKVAKSS